MLSYQHEYHFGNHADVLKHSTLALCIRALQAKESPIRVFDSHAGAGRYETGTAKAKRNPEFRNGIGRLWSLVDSPADLPKDLSPYLEVVRALNDGRELKRYPGSPLIARRLLRKQDQLALLELHPEAANALARLFARDPGTHLHFRDSYEGLPALLPPPERRGLVLIDPSYEVKEEFNRVRDLLVACHRRWPAGTFLVWYPLIRHAASGRFPSKIAASGIRDIYRVELRVEDDGFQGLRGSGVLIVNLPYGLQNRLEKLAPWLWQSLSTESRGGFRAEWLVPE
jgi:23S rRNA (adenine2030-N6)-methyltransferase